MMACLQGILERYNAQTDALSLDEVMEPKIIYCSRHFLHQLMRDFRFIVWARYKPEEERVPGEYGRWFGCGARITFVLDPALKHVDEGEQSHGTYAR